jgi:hypothetical protein
VKQGGGKVIEFNLEPTPLSEGGAGFFPWGPRPADAVSDWLFLGPAGTTVPAVIRLALASAAKQTPAREP